ncbi:MAG: glycosyltransferase family 4 protein [Chloroflexi bacterium]|nr:glycosyltransferase family 4 protein [Chloroflexota bacterium]
MDRDSLNILMVAPTSFFSSYGCHVRIAEEADALRHMGHRVKVVTYRNGGSWNGLPIERTPAIPYRHDYEVGSSRHKLVFDALLGAKLLQVAHRDKPDIIHAHLHEGALLGFPAHLLTRAPLVFDFQGSLTSEMVDHRFLKRDGRMFRSMLHIERAINNLPDAVIASSQRGVRLLREQFGCRKERVVVVADCVNARVFRPDVLSHDERNALKLHLGIPLERKVVVYLGLLADYQGTGLLLEAAHEMLRAGDNVHFLIMGYPSVDVYRARAEALGVASHTTFTGRINYPDAPRFLALGDVAVAPKVSATEGIGKVLNYMSLALPTVTFDTEVSREYLGERGIYAEPGSSSALARALRTALQPESRVLGCALREHALKNYTWERAGQKIVELYQTCLS